MTKYVVESHEKKSGKLINAFEFIEEKGAKEFAIAIQSLDPSRVQVSMHKREQIND